VTSRFCKTKLLIANHAATGMGQQRSVFNGNGIINDETQLMLISRIHQTTTFQTEVMKAFFAVGVGAGRTRKKWMNKSGETEMLTGMDNEKKKLGERRKANKRVEFEKQRKNRPKASNFEDAGLLQLIKHLITLPFAIH
jgi:hypothetical protein